MTHRYRWGSAAAVASLIVGGLALTAAPQAAQAADWSRCLNGSSDRQAVFARAADVSGVPQKVLLGVSYLESRWDDHGRRSSSSGGYGPMHLTQDAVAAHAARGREGQGRRCAGHVVDGHARAGGEAHRLSPRRLRTDDVANICGGAAVLAADQPGTTVGTARRPGARRSRPTPAPPTPQERLRFADQVFDRAPHRRARTTNDGQRVTLAADPGAAWTPPRSGRRRSRPATRSIDCPVAARRASRSRRRTSSTADTVASTATTTSPTGRTTAVDRLRRHPRHRGHLPDRAIDLVTDPTYLGWHYTINSANGHVAQHINPKNVGFHAGNWYVNMHSIGIEHTGFAATGATWYTESMYRSSAALVKHLGDGVRHPARPRARHRARPGPGHQSPSTSRACTGTRAPTGTGSTT